MDSSDEGVGSIDTTGLALKGGWVILGVKDPETDSTLASTDTVWVMGGRPRSTGVTAGCSQLGTPS